MNKLSVEERAALRAPRLHANVPLRRHPRREFDVDLPKGIRAGDLTLNPSFAVTYEYTDNALASRARDAERDFVLSAEPGLALRYVPGPDVEIDGGYRLGWNNYLDDIARDYLEHGALLNVRWRHAGTRGLTVGLSDIYSEASSSIKSFVLCIPPPVDEWTRRLLFIFASP